MRGALLLIGVLLLSTRIIPADAGSTLDGAGFKDYHQDHPRGCGEHNNSAFSQLIVQGSSPRMRGAHYVGLAFGPDHGIIPADAGSTPGIGVQGLQ